MDPAPSESGGGKSLTSKLKAKVPHSRVKDKVKNLKNRLPGMKKHGGEEDAHEDSSEYEENSPRGPVPETGHNVADSTPLTPGKAVPDSNSPRLSPPREVHNQGFDSRPAQTGYDAENRNYVAAAPPTRPAPLPNDSPRSNLAPGLEEKFQHLGVGENPTSPRGGADPSPNTRGFQPEQPQQQSSPSTTESVQKGYSDVPRNSYRANSMPATTASNKGMLEKVKDTVVGATAVLGDKVGYYNDHTPTDPNAPTILAKAKSTLGVDKPRDPNAPPLTQRAKSYVSVANLKTREYGATVADHAAWTKDRVAAQATPTHHDKALSEQVTQSLSSLPGAIKEKMFGPASPSPRAANSPGIVDRVSGAVSSLFTPASKETGAHVQHTFPAHSDHDAAAAGPPSAPADRRSAPQEMPATSPPAYSTVNN